MARVRFLHAADVHVALREREYCLEVVDEVAEVAKDAGVDFVVVPGDLFDSFEDMAALWGEVWRRLCGVGVPVYYCVGNHEFLKKGAHEFSEFSTPEGLFWSFDGVGVWEGEGYEVVGVPYRREGYEGGGGLARKRGVRVVMAHGTVQDAFWFSSEEDPAILDPVFLRDFEPDYVALGHIHRECEVRFGDVVFRYAGSARVWREGEEGPRRVLVVEAGEGGVRVESVALERAGRFRVTEVVFGVERVEEEEGFWDGVGPYDRVHVVLRGVVDGLDRVESWKRGLLERYGDRVRTITFEEEVAALRVLSSHRFVQMFLEEMERSRGGCEERVWRDALRLGLLRIREEIER
ncbi:metallophosphoesterase [Spirochaeta thermophila DSM 6578]|uniref:Metallophosphoesterase n=1 Tax=Winmispira thermophila (strain ATCC 700085 / DSM 6578 / Z-1203) TaxID=869211 RepID=G0GG09_WINT7|nr:DNA repair exonuclease [Spirochaeta thermophila]AEJ62485.1 metallophosphoesterase [Spirochaeta thermophila DSM 6578]